MKPQDLFDLIKDTFKAWSEDKAARLAAALSYYAVFSLAPLLVIIISIAGLILGRQAAQNQIVVHIQGLVGKSTAEFIQEMVKSARNQNASIVATAIGIATLIFGATGVFGQLQETLNAIWDIPQDTSSGLMGVVRERSLAFAMVLGIGLLVLLTLGIDGALLAVSKFAGGLIPGISIFWQIVNMAVSFGIMTLSFALIFKVIPNAEIHWRDVWLGALVTAALFAVGKYLIGIYLSNASVSSSYGAAGSLVVILLWIYYSAQILFFGAEFTQVYANRFGSKIITAYGPAEQTPGRPKIPSSSVQEKSLINQKPDNGPASAAEPAGASPKIQLQPHPPAKPSLLAFSTIIATLFGFAAGFFIRRVMD